MKIGTPSRHEFSGVHGGVGGGAQLRLTPQQAQEKEGIEANLEELREALKLEEDPEKKESIDEELKAGQGKLDALMDDIRVLLLTCCWGCTAARHALCWSAGSVGVASSSCGQFVMAAYNPRTHAMYRGVSSSISDRSWSEHGTGHSILGKQTGSVHSWAECWEVPPQSRCRQTHPFL